VNAMQSRPLFCQTMSGCLIAMACVLCIVQWTVGRRFLTSSVFDPRRATILHNFGQFRAALQSEVLRQCASGNIRHIYFDDLEVGVPYIVNATVGNPSCQLVRTTPVTPLAPNDRGSCSAITILEKHLSWWLPGVMQADLGASATQVTLLRDWNSDDRSYGFDVYRGRVCGDAAKDVPQ
jgi:hypothetical protein